MHEFNPYAPPKSDIPSILHAGGCWRDGKVLVMSRDAELPDRCVKCNAPGDGRRMVRMLSWHPPYWFALVVISPLLYIVVALIVRYTAKIKVSICHEHRSRRIRGIAIAWLCGLGGIGLMIAAGALLSSQYVGMSIILGAILILVGLIYGVVISQLVVPKKIDKRFIWLNKVHPDLLASFPDWEG